MTGYNSCYKDTLGCSNKIKEAAVVLSLAIALLLCRFLLELHADFIA